MDYTDAATPKQTHESTHPTLRVTRSESDVPPWLDLTRDDGRTDVANARRFADSHADKLKYCHQWKKWLAWDGKRWQVDASGRAQYAAKSVSDDIWILSQRLDNDPARQWAMKTAQAPRIKAMLELAQSEPSLVVHPGNLDANPWLLNCANGTLDLRTQELRKHNRDDLITKLCPTEFSWKARGECKVWEQFVASIFGDDEGLMDFCQRHAGHCLTGDIREQMLFIAYGQGSNGKSTYLNAILATMGTDYAMQGAPDMLMADRNETHATERMDLFGMRLVSCVETNETAKLNESFVKQLTGGERIRGRRVYENPWEFLPSHKIILATNHKPRIRGTDHAIWRRLRLVPFIRKYWNPDKGETGPPELRQDKELDRKLDEARSGILLWAVRGCKMWLEDGLPVPDAVKVATEEYRGQEDVVGAFLRECCTDTGIGRTTFKTLYDGLVGYADQTGQNAPSRKFVSGYLEREGYTRVATGGTVRFEGVALVQDDGEGF